MTVRYRLRLVILGVVFTAGFGGLLAKLWSLQVDQYDKYSQLLPGTSNVTVRVPGVRGEIKDRNGVTLVSNEPNYEVLFDLKEIVRAYRAQYITVPTISYLATVKGFKESRTEPDIVAVVNDFIIPGLEELGLAAPYSRRELELHFRGTRGIVPWSYRDNLTFEEFATFAEHNLGLPGVTVSVRPKRLYRYGSLACHILGYVKEVKPGDVDEEERSKFDFYVGDETGVAGIERSMNRQLRARNGQRIMLKDEKGAVVGEIGYEKPGRGSDVYLTIDARIQMIAERALLESGAGRAAITVIQPDTGDILAMASLPNYDPNRFIPSISGEDWKRYTMDETNMLMNRAIKDYPPGSTFKVPVALAGCYAGVGGNYLVCDGGQQYGRKFMRCWIHSKGGAHGTLGLDESLMRSCNDFFYQFGNLTGIKSIRTVTGLLGLGSKTGIPLEEEDPGIVPDPDALKLRQGEVWSPAQTALVAIGQGKAEATPLQMASVAATVASGGIKHTPWLISKFVEPDGAVVEQARPKSIDLKKEGLAAKDIETVRRGMWMVVNAIGGTAKRAKSTGYDTAGKTGTAQDFRWDDRLKATVKDNRAWFISFAPYDKPKLAICVMVANGKSGGGVGAPIAARVIEESLALERGFKADLVAMAEAPGSFDGLESVTYGDQPASAFFEDEGETGNEVDIDPPRLATRVGPGAVEVAAPTLRQEADGAPKAVPVLKPSVRFKPASPKRKSMLRRGRRR